jgi:hypothetical protein
MREIGTSLLFFVLVTWLFAIHYERVLLLSAYSNAGTSTENQQPTNYVPFLFLYDSTADDTFYGSHHM